jgi:hypothetical protein
MKIPIVTFSSLLMCRDGFETKISASATVPGNSTILDYGSDVELENYVWDVDINGGY